MSIDSTRERGTRFLLRIPRRDRTTLYVSHTSLTCCDFDVDYRDPLRTRMPAPRRPIPRRLIPPACAKRRFCRRPRLLVLPGARALHRPRDRQGS